MTYMTYILYIYVQQSERERDREHKMKEKKRKKKAWKGGVGKGTTGFPVMGALNPKNNSTSCPLIRIIKTGTNSLTKPYQIDNKRNKNCITYIIIIDMSVCHIT